MTVRQRKHQTLDTTLPPWFTENDNKTTTMKRLFATAALAVSTLVLALNCDRIGYEFAGGAILLATGLAFGYCLTVKEARES